MSQPSLTITLPDFVVATGVSSGLGEECARLLTRAGTKVVGVDVNAVAPDLAVSSNFQLVQASITEDSTWNSVLVTLDTWGSTSADSLGFLGVAAVLDVGVLLDETLENWERAWRVNVLGHIRGLQHVLPRLIQAKFGSVVVISSVDAKFAEQQLASYASSKAALELAIKTIALDYARTGVNFNILAPGPMRAGLFERHLASADDPGVFLATRTKRQPVGRIIGADEVAHAAAFLLSPSASALFGSTITADGGLTVGFDFRTGEDGSSAR